MFLDYDGTLSDIVRHADQATPIEGVAELLVELSRRFRLVSIVSGRGTPELVEWLGEGVEIWGVHGAQHSHKGETRWTSHVTPHLPVMAEIRDLAEEAVAARGDGSIVEDKGVMVALHYRPAHDPEAAKAALSDLADDLVKRFDLVRSDGRMVIELRPQVELSKAGVVLERTRDLDLAAVLFAGDDRVDLPAFDAVDQLIEQGVIGVKVAVDSPEAPEELLARADIVVDDPQGLVRLLKSLITK
ncbi:MAG: trehalose 6-phosphate phosphatase [Actinomycetota bacterium]|nr:trehalose 6-phosphate phosphatase [Actinomycetota bacterium]